MTSPTPSLEGEEKNGSCFDSFFAMVDECETHEDHCGVAIWLDPGCVCKCATTPSDTEEEK